MLIQSFQLPLVFRLLALLACILLAAPTVKADIDHPCHEVLREAGETTEVTMALQVLGGCLAAPAASRLHERVVLEMAIISLRQGDQAFAMRYLDILKDMFEDEPVQ